MTRDEFEKLYPSIDEDKKYVSPEEFHKTIKIIDPFEEFNIKEIGESHG